MRVFVTGASGFLGSYLVADLVNHGHEVAALVRQGSSTSRLQGLLSRITVVYGSLDDQSDLASALRQLQPEAVAHLAWRGVANSERNNPDQARNIVDATNLVKLAADAGATVFVGAGSQAEYGPYSRAIAPDDATNPTTVYGMAKLAAGRMVMKIAEDRGMRSAWLRIFSTYGAKDSEHWLIPSFILALAKGEKMQLTRGEQRWGFLHARDAAAALRLAITRPDGKGFFNLGHPDAPLLRDTLTKLRDLVNPSCDLAFGDIPYRHDQVMILQADIHRLEQLGWAPSVDLEEGLRETVNWYVDPKRN